MRTFEELYRDDIKDNPDAKSENGRREARRLYDRLMESDLGHDALAAMRYISTYSDRDGEILLQIIAASPHLPQNIHDLGDKIGVALHATVSHNTPWPHDWHDYHSAGIAWSKQTHIFVR